MPTEKLINQSLSEKLDSLPLQSSSTFDKRDAWEKLHNRLGIKKQNPRKPVWIWWAAAFMATLTSLVFLLRDNSSGNGNENIVAAPQKFPASFEELPKEKIVTIEKKDIFSETKKSKRILTTNNHLTKKNSKKPVLLSEPKVTNLALVQDVEIDTNTLQVQIVSSAPVVVKKNMKVLHVNELAGQRMIKSTVENNTDIVFNRSLIPGHRKQNGDYEVNEIPFELKSKKSILPFGRVISQKE